MTQKDNGHLEIEDRGATLIVRVDGGPHSLFGIQSPTSSRRWWTGPTVIPACTPWCSPARARAASSAMPTCGGFRQRALRCRIEPPQRVGRPAPGAGRGPGPRARPGAAQKTPLRGVAQLDRLHATFLR